MQELDLKKEINAIATMPIEPVSSMWHPRLAGLKLALSLAGGSQTLDSNEEIVQLRLGEPQAGSAESHLKE